VAKSETIVRLPLRVQPATEFRSTLVCASQGSLKAHGYFDTYAKSLAPELATDLLTLVPGEWKPVKLALAHYLACDALPMPSAEREQLGSEVGRRLKESLVSTMARLSRGAGATPWLLVENLDKLNSHTWRGGAFSATREGPKDAIVEWHGQPCAVSHHFVVGYLGFVSGLMELFCRKAFVRLLPGRSDETRIAYAVSWA